MAVHAIPIASYVPSELVPTGPATSTLEPASTRKFLAKSGIATVLIRHSEAKGEKIFLCRGYVLSRQPPTEM